MLHNACKHGFHEGVILLCQAGANPNQRSGLLTDSSATGFLKGMTPLQIICTEFITNMFADLDGRDSNRSGERFTSAFTSACHLMTFGATDSAFPRDFKLPLSGPVRPCLQWAGKKCAGALQAFLNDWPRQLPMQLKEDVLQLRGIIALMDELHKNPSPSLSGDRRRRFEDMKAASKKNKEQAAENKSKNAAAAWFDLSRGAAIEIWDARLWDRAYTPPLSGNLVLQMTHLLDKDRRLLNKHDDKDHHEEAATALYYAATRGDVKMVEFLCGRGADPHQTSSSGSTPLHQAAGKLNVAIVKALLHKGALATAKISEHQDDEGFTEGFTPLHLVLLDISGLDKADAEKRALELEIARLLLGGGAPVNHTSKSGLTPLHMASRRGRLSMVKLLLENGAAQSLDLMFNGMTPIQMALNEHPAVVEALQKAAVQLAEQHERQKKEMKEREEREAKERQRLERERAERIARQKKEREEQERKEAEERERQRVLKQQMLSAVKTLRERTKVPMADVDIVPLRAAIDEVEKLTVRGRTQAADDASCRDDRLMTESAKLLTFVSRASQQFRTLLCTLRQLLLDNAPGDNVNHELRAVDWDSKVAVLLADAQVFNVNDLITYVRAAGSATPWEFRALVSAADAERAELSGTASASVISFQKAPDRSGNAVVFFSVMVALPCGPPIIRSARYSSFRKLHTQLLEQAPWRSTLPTEFPVPKLYTASSVFLFQTMASVHTTDALYQRMLDLEVYLKNALQDSLKHTGDIIPALRDFMGLPPNRSAAMRPLEELSISELRRVIDLGGLTHSDCIEKVDLLVRARAARGDSSVATAPTATSSRFVYHANPTAAVFDAGGGGAPAHVSSNAPPVSSNVGRGRGSGFADLDELLKSVGLPDLKPKFEDVDLLILKETMEAGGSTAVRELLSDIGVSMGQRQKLINALTPRAGDEMI